MIADKSRPDRVNVDRIKVDSAGTASYHIGSLPDPRMIEAAAKRGYPLTSHAKAITQQMIGERDLVLAMDRENLQNIERVFGASSPHIKLLSTYVDHSWPTDVPDPYYGGPEGFEYVLDMLEAASVQILKEIRSSSAGTRKRPTHPN
jgi:protein-tyrosine phosphatase